MAATELETVLAHDSMPTVQYLLNGDLESLRAAIRNTSAQEDAMQWVASHVVLGAALRLRASRVGDDERLQMYMEAVRAFDVALTVCYQHHASEDFRAQAMASAKFSARPDVCTTRPDGVQLVVDATTVPVTEGNALMARAIRVFRDACTTSNRKTALRTWFVGMSNLGCTLTLLGRRTPGVAGIATLEEAVDVLQDALKVPSTEDMSEERASTQVNLAEAFQSLAEKGMPAEKLRYIEQAADWMAAALCHFAPPHCRWLLHVEPRSLV